MGLLSSRPMKHLTFVLLVPAAVVALSGCAGVAPSTASPHVVFAREESGGWTYYLQPHDAGRAPTPLALPPGTGNLQTSADGTVAAATVPGAAPGSAELRLVAFATQGTGGMVLAREWAWDFSLRRDGGAIAWVAGEERRLFVARAPVWTPVAVPLPAGAGPAEPRWLGPAELLVVLRRGARSELVALAVDSGATRVVYRASGDATLTAACPVPGSDDVLLVEAAPDAAPGRLLRVPLAGGEPRVLAAGFLVPGTLAVSPDGRCVVAAWARDLATVRRREAGLLWLGGPWRGAPADGPGVSALAWSPDGRQLAVARQEAGRQWIEIHAEGAAPRVIGFPGAVCFAPQWWMPSRGPFFP